MTWLGDTNKQVSDAERAKLLAKREVLVEKVKTLSKLSLVPSKSS